jgi:hypothetical protein
MERRAFMTAAVSGALVPAARSSAGELLPAPRLLLLELRRYRLHNGPMATRFTTHVETALIPALNRAGCSPVGAWSVALGAEAPTLHLLLPHQGGDSVVTLEERLANDPEYRRAAAALLAVPATDPPFLRCESSLHRAVASVPGVDRNAALAAGASRVFELRTYRSHSEAASRRKIEMFETGGELAIFKRLGLKVVFFARDLVGAGLPSLSYLLVFADAAARQAAWTAFRQDPQWLELRARTQYADAEIVSGISSLLLRPAAGSQL